MAEYTELQRISWKYTYTLTYNETIELNQKVLIPTNLKQELLDVVRPNIIFDETWQSAMDDSVKHL